LEEYFCVVRGGLESLTLFGASRLPAHTWSLPGWCIDGAEVLDEQQPSFRVVVATAEPKGEPQQSCSWDASVSQSVKWFQFQTPVK